MDTVIPRFEKWGEARKRQWIEQEFSRLSDAEKVEVMQDVIRRALRHLTTARAPGSDYVTFLAFIAGDTFEETVIRPLEMISGWSERHTESAHRRADLIHDDVTKRLEGNILKSPTEKFRHLKRLLLGGSITAAGIGLAVVARMVLRAKAKRGESPTRVT